MNIETVRNQLKTLKLHTAAAELQEALAQHKKAVSLSWISDLLEREIDSRREKALMTRIKKANFPEITTLETFDWSFNPQIDENRIRQIAAMDLPDMSFPGTAGNRKDPSCTGHRSVGGKQGISCLLQ